MPPILNSQIKFPVVIKYFLFLAIIATIVVLTLINRDLLKGLYIFIAGMTPLDPAIVAEHTTGVSNAGHFIASFVLTILMISIFNTNFLITTISVASFALLCELSQLLTATRQANLEDILLSLTGISFALILQFLFNKCSTAKSN